MRLDWPMRNSSRFVPLNVLADGSSAVHSTTIECPGFGVKSPKSIVAGLPDAASEWIV